jgi:hypothetical protein
VTEEQQKKEMKMEQERPRRERGGQEQDKTKADRLDAYQEEQEKSMERKETLFTLAHSVRARGQ